jgi:hypothetical protein
MRHHIWYFVESGQGHCKLMLPFSYHFQPLYQYTEIVRTRNGLRLGGEETIDSLTLSDHPVCRAFYRTWLNLLSSKLPLPTGWNAALRSSGELCFPGYLSELFRHKRVCAHSACEPKEFSLVTPLLKQAPIRHHLIAPPIWLSVQDSTMHGNSPRDYSCFSHPQNKEGGIIHDWKLATKC